MTLYVETFWHLPRTPLIFDISAHCCHRYRRGESTAPAHASPIFLFSRTWVDPCYRVGTKLPAYRDLLSQNVSTKRTPSHCLASRPAPPYSLHHFTTPLILPTLLPGFSPSGWDPYSYPRAAGTFWHCATPQPAPHTVPHMFLHHTSPVFTPSLATASYHLTASVTACLPDGAAAAAQTTATSTPGRRNLLHCCGRRCTAHGWTLLHAAADYCRLTLQHCRRAHRCHFRIYTAGPLCLIDHTGFVYHFTRTCVPHLPACTTASTHWPTVHGHHLRLKHTTTCCSARTHCCEPRFSLCHFHIEFRGRRLTRDRYKRWDCHSAAHH